MAVRSSDDFIALYSQIYFACHTRHVHDAESGTRVSARQVSILSHLDSVEPTPLSQLAAHMGVTVSTMSIAVDRLVRQGYVVRARAEADARVRHVRLTASGERLRAAQKVLEPRLVRAMLSRLPRLTAATRSVVSSCSARRPGNRRRCVAATGRSRASAADHIHRQKTQEPDMRWILGTAGVLVGLVLLVYGVGLLLPRSHVASASAQYAAPPSAIWSTLTDVAAFPQWRPDLTRIEVLPEQNGQRGWREVGKTEAVSYRLVESAEGQRLVTRIADENLPYGGTWTYELAPAGSGTRLTITERGEIYNPIFRFVARFFLGYTSTMTGVLRAIGAKHGETVTPTTAASR